MHFSTILSTIVITLSVANAVAIDNDVEPRDPAIDNIFDPRDTGQESTIESRQQSSRPLLTLTGLRDMAGSRFTGVGVPGRCYNLPQNVREFQSAQPIAGYRCDIWDNFDCRGSILSVGTSRVQALSRPARIPQWRSWRCWCGSCPL